MLVAGSPLARDLERLYADSVMDVRFPALLGRIDPAADEALAELIELDGRMRVALGRFVDLRRYLDAVPDLGVRSVPLDAAIDVTLRSLSGSSRPLATDVETLIANYPHLEQPIREAALLAEAMWSTSGLRRRVGPAVGRQLPCDLGPPIPSGGRRYELREFLNAGGWGEVYLAVDRQLSEDDRPALVAVKILAAQDDMPWARQRFLDEATKARRINHPNVVRVLDRGVSDKDEHFIVYEYIEGGDLGGRLDRDSAHHSPRDAAGLVARIARGVHAAHMANVVHCDLKPGNILLTGDGEPMVADFGIAVRGGEQPDTPPAPEGSRFPGNMAFVSPEQFRLEEGCLSAPSDIYAIGGILYFLLTRELPNGSTVEEIAQNHEPADGRTEPPSPRARRPGLDRDLDLICRRAMALRPDDRYSSAAALAEDLEAWRRREPIRWTRPSPWRVAGLWVGRHRGVAAGLAAATLALGAGSAVAAHWSGVAATQQQEARAATATVGLAQGEVARFHGMLKFLKRDRLDQELLPMIMAWEWLEGPTILGPPGDRSQLWQDRVAVVRNLVDENRRAGRADDFETLLWETALGFWLLSDGDAAEAESRLADVDARWHDLLGPDDRWARQVHLLRTSATVKRLLTDRAPPLPPDDRRAELERAAAALASQADAFKGRSAGGPMHRLVLKIMIDLHGEEEGGLDRPQTVKSLRNTLKAVSR